MSVTANPTTVSKGGSVAYTLNYTGTLSNAQYALYYYATSPGTPTLVATWAGAQPVHVFQLDTVGYYVVVATAWFPTRTEVKTSEIVQVVDTAPYVITAGGAKVAASTTTDAILISNKKPEKQLGQKTSFSIKTGGSATTHIKWELYKASDNSLVLSDEGNQKTFVLNTATLGDQFMNKDSKGNMISTDFYVKVYLTSDTKAPYTYQWWQSQNVTVYLPVAPESGL